MRLAPALLVLLVVAGGALPEARAQPPRDPGPDERTERPEGAEQRIPAAWAVRIARSDEKVRRARRERGELEARPEREPGARWRIGFFDRGEEVAQVYVDGRSGRITESWDGDQVAWKMARGYEGAFGRTFNAPYVWLPLGLVFLLAFFDWRRPLRLVHLDLLVLLGFGFSHVLFNAAHIELSVPLAYPVLLYLLARMLWIGGRGPGPGLRPVVPLTWLVVGLLLLLGFRVGLNVTDSNVIDVGYAGVIGAERIASGEEVYGTFPSDNHAGDTYGPVAYYAYVPFELLWPWSGEWDALPAAHAAAISFDLAVVLGLFVLGRLLRGGRQGTALGVALAFAWTAYPYSTFVLATNANDALIAALVVWSLVVLASPPARGALAALAGLTKFAPLALVPLLATWRSGQRAESERPGVQGFVAARAGPAALFTVAFTATTALVMAQTALAPGPDTFWERTVSFQADRDSPFSVWSQWGLPAAQTAVQVGAVALALFVAFVPRTKTVWQVAALGAAILIAVQLGLPHWFYLYVAWFAPLALVALAHDPRRDALPPTPPPPGGLATEPQLRPDRPGGPSRLRPGARSLP